MKVRISVTVNGELHEIETKPNRTLSDLIRFDLGLTGTKKGCGQGKCGTCTVLVNDMPVNSCLILAPQVDGKSVVTIEGLGADGVHPLQTAFVQKGAVQCGYCTPGMIMTAKSLLDQIPHPTEMQVKEAIGGNLCRCTGYVKIVDAVMAAASSEDKERADV